MLGSISTKRERERERETETETETETEIEDREVGVLNVHSNSFLSQRKMELEVPS
jgi:hypothetical protein